MKQRFNNYFNKIESIINDNRVYLITTIIMLSVYFLCLMITSSFPFGRLYPVPGDGMIQAFAVQSSIHDKINAGNIFSFYSFDVASFIDISNNMIYYLIHPWIIIKYLIISKNNLIYLYILELLCNYLLAPISIIFYLTHRYHDRFCKSDNRLIYIGLIYGLSNYAISFYTYSTFNYLQLLPFLALGIEQIIYKNKSSLYTAILSYTIIADPYHAFLLCMFLILLFITYKFSSIKHFLTSGIRFAINSVISALLSSIVLIPFYLRTVSDSPYKEKDNELPSIINSFDSYFRNFYNYHIANLDQSVSDNYSSASIYCGLLAMLVVLVYIFNKKIDTTSKLKKIIILGLLYISFNNELLNYIFHGFHYQSYVPNRNAGFFIFLICTLLADVLFFIDTSNKKVVLLQMIPIGIVFLIISIMALDKSKITTILSLIIISSYIFILLVGLLIKKNTSQIFKAIIYLGVFEIILNSLFNFSHTISYKPNSVNLTNDIDTIAEQYPELQKFYNSTEYLGDVFDYSNIGYSSKINSISCFTSGLNTDTINRLNDYNLFCSVNNVIYRCGNPLADMLLHVKYHIEDVNDDGSFSIYPISHQYNQYIIHENPYYLSLGFVINDKNLNETIIDKYSDNSFNNQNKICKYLGGNSIYNEIEIEQYSNNENINYFILGETYEETNANTTQTEYRTVSIHLNDDIKGYIYANVNHTLYCIGKADETNHDFSIDYSIEDIGDLKSFKPRIAIFNENEFKKLHNILNKSILTNLNDNGRKITGDYTSTSNGVLYISVPYSNNWKIYIDGNKVEYSRYLGGLGIEVEPGQHSLEMRYTPPGMLLGLIISLTTLLLIIIYHLLIYKKNKKS